MNVELLAPAGDLERLKVAIDYGADAVYIGYQELSLRANAINFTYEDIKEAVKYAHDRNKKVYVTVNIVLHHKELTIVDSSIKKLSEIGVDALIISDPAVFKYAKKYNMEIHLSTQASTMNYKSAEFFKEQGVKRVVLARECKREDIKKIISTGIDVETFIHGAMCAGISGRCVMSNIFTNRDANRGGCSQICRWDFELLDENKNNITKDKPFTFCSKDLSMIEYIDDMIKIGIKSFKIEGRMRSSYYLATIVSIYRKVIDNCLKHNKSKAYTIKDKQILDNCSNRDSIAQFYNGVYDSTCSYYNGRVEVSNQDFLGIILDYDSKNNLATVEQRNYFKKGDIVEIFSANHEIIEFKIDKIYDEDGNIIEIVRHPKQIVKIYIDEKLDKGDFMRIKRN